jgi:hypothetical protein
MEKQILLELQRMRQIMGYDRDNPKEFIFEQDFEGGDGSVEVLKEKDIEEIRYPEVILGPGTDGVKYPILIPIPNGVKVMGDRITGLPIVSQFKPTTTAIDLIPPDKLKIETGEIKNKNGEVLTNQQYYVGTDGKKYCLPRKEWWELNTKFAIVYKFTNPRNGKEFVMKFGYKETEGKTSQQLQLECNTLDNGWTFNLKNFYEKGTPNPYNPSNTEHFDTRSDDDVFWDDMGLYVEIVVGVAVAFLIPPLAAAIAPLIAVGELAWLGTLVYAAGEATWLRVILEIMVEASLLSPYIINQLSRGGDSAQNGYLTLVFCLIPFLTELPAVSKFIRFGAGTPDASFRIQKKMTDWGGISKLRSEIARLKSIYSDSEATIAVENLMSQITDDAIEKQILYKGLDLIKIAGDDPKIIQAAFAQYLTKHGDTIEAGVLRKAEDIADDGTASIEEMVIMDMKKAMQKNLNPISGKGLLPAFARGALVIGPIALGFNKGWDVISDLIRQKFSDPEVQGATAENIKNMMKNSEYFKAYAQLVKDLELPDDYLNELALSVANKSLLDPNFTSDINKQTEILTEQIKKLVPEETKKQEEEMAKKVIEDANNSTGILVNFSHATKYERFASRTLLRTMIEELGFTLSAWEKMENTNYNEPWVFTSDGKEGKVIFIGGNKEKYEIYVDNKKIFPN